MKNIKSHGSKDTTPVVLAWAIFPSARTELRFSVIKCQPSSFPLNTFLMTFFTVCRCLSLSLATVHRPSSHTSSPPVPVRFLSTTPTLLFRCHNSLIIQPDTTPQRVTFLGYKLALALTNGDTFPAEHTTTMRTNRENTEKYIIIIQKCFNLIFALQRAAGLTHRELSANSTSKQQSKNMWMSQSRVCVRSTAVIESSLNVVNEIHVSYYMNSHLEHSSCRS